MKTVETYCDVCGHRDSWGCGHTGTQRSAARRHRQTVKHYRGKCDCFEYAPGYMPPAIPATRFATIKEWREYLSE